MPLLLHILKSVISETLQQPPTTVLVTLLSLLSTILQVIYSKNLQGMWIRTNNDQD